MLPASLLILGILGGWAFRHRKADFWLLMGVTAIVSRFWIYHRWYDDLILLLPMVALFRIAKQGPTADGRDVMAGILLALTWAFSLAPGGRYLLPAPWNALYIAAQVIVWATVLVFLLHQARQAA
jgi:hypothetical protein